MNSRDKDKLYKAVKWLWLLLQAVILPLAALHAVTVPPEYWPLFLPAPLLIFAGVVFLVLWLIAQSLLAMARFPLTLNKALLLVGGTVAQLVFLVGSGGSLTSASYAVFFATMAALAMVTVILAVVAIGRKTLPPAARLAALLVQLPVAGMIWFMLTPLRPAFSRLPFWREMLEWIFLTVNSGLVVFSLFRFSVFAAAAEADAAYDREWESWAAPTIIVLILSAAAAVVVAGVSSRMGR